MLEIVPRAINLVSHQMSKRHGDVTISPRLIIVAEGDTVLPRYVNPAAVPIARNILAKVDQLQAGANSVRTFKIDRRMATPKVENHVAHWIGRVATIFQ